MAVRDASAFSLIGLLNFDGQKGPTRSSTMHSHRLDLRDGELSSWPCFCFATWFGWKLFLFTETGDPQAASPEILGLCSLCWIMLTKPQSPGHPVSCVYGDRKVFVHKSYSNRTPALDDDKDTYIKSGVPIQKVWRANEAMTRSYLSGVTMLYRRLGSNGTYA